MQNSSLRVTISVLVLSLLIAAAILPSTVISVKAGPAGFSKGVSWQSVVPVKKATFVGFDKHSYLDDYAYLASVPSSVFYDDTTEKLFSNPLLFYQDEYPVTNITERSLNAHQGLDYFMQDWSSYCNGRLDEMTLINVPKTKVSTWSARNTSVINGENPFTLASAIALHDWSYSNDAVVAVINDDTPSDQQIETTAGKVSGKLDIKSVHTTNFRIPQTNHMYPQYKEFNVPEGYKLLRVRSWYPSVYFGYGLPIPSFENTVNMTIPPGDRDLQLYCKHNDDWMETALTISWNAKNGMDRDKTETYVYKNGPWKVGLTDTPTKTPFFSLPQMKTTDQNTEPEVHRSLEIPLGILSFGRYGKLIDVLKNMRKVEYQIDVEMYSGTTIEIPEVPSFGCHDSSFKLTWDDPNACLGFSLIGPNGEEINYARNESKTSEQELLVDKIGDCPEGEHYSVCVYALNNASGSVDFELAYSWQKKSMRKTGDGLASATEGAVLGSILNAPLLFVSPNKVLQTTRDTLYKLGVRNIYLVNLGGHLSSHVLSELQGIANLKSHFREYQAIYDGIKELTGRNDVIFTTLDPWTYWRVAELEPAGEHPGALFIGSAAYLAAHHGSPVVIVDNHPELASAVTYHTDFWRKYPDGIERFPTVACMYLTGKRVYEFLDDYGFDKEGKETIVTVAGQFDIGLPWDRVYVGKAYTGRFLGSPVDTSTWISRTIFYPSLIFENPALQGPVSLINGSKSVRKFPWWGRLGLRIVKPSQEEEFSYPALSTQVCYDHRFNERASKYFGFKYKCADGTIPGETVTFNQIDEGVCERYLGKEGACMPDLSGSDVQPFYLKKAGYDPVFSTNFTSNMENLRRGVIMWMINTHGGPFDGGQLMFWDPQGKGMGFPAIPGTGAKKENNPWRGYEWLMGSTKEPDTMTADIHGIIPALLGNPNINGILRTGFDWAPAKKPILDKVSKVANLPLLRSLAPEWLKDTNDYYDGVIATVFLTRFFTGWFNATRIDDSIDNLHSCGVSSVACLPAGKFLHLSMVRHGSVFQIMDPWSTSWYSTVWQNMIPRGIALGKTIGETFSEGLSKVGILYITDPPQWWWDLWENVCLFGDPDLRVWTPSTEYSSMNHWDKPVSLKFDDDFRVDGHMPFGATGHPHKITPIPWTLIAVALGGLVVGLAAILIFRKQRHSS